MIEKNVFELDFIPGISLLNKPEKKIIHFYIFQIENYRAYIFMGYNKIFYTIIKCMPVINAII